MKTEVEIETSTPINLRPLADRIVIRRDEEQDKTDGGIFLPDNAREKVNRGTVVATGEGKLNDDGTRSAPQVEPGDIVLFSKFGGDDLRIGDQEWLLIRESEILGVME